MHISAKIAIYSNKSLIKSMLSVLMLLLFCILLLVYNIRYEYVAVTFRSEEGGCQARF